MRPSLRDSILSVLVTSSIFRFLRASTPTSYRIRLAQRRNFPGLEAELLEHRICVFTDARRMRDQPARRARQGHRLADQLHQRLILLLDTLRDAKMLDLRIGKHLINGINRSGGHARFVEAVYPIRASPIFGVAVDLGI